jgi:hypothetical protein
MSNGEVTVLRESRQIIHTMEDAERAARAMSSSGFFQDSKSAAQAVVKILAGQELGFGPFASMTGVHIIQGKPSIGANLMAAAVKSSGKYNYRVTAMSETQCSIDFYEGKEKVGTSTFTLDDAKKADLTGKDTWKKYAKNLLFARALSNGVRWYAPDIFNGSPVYTPEELGAEVDEEGNVVAPVVEALPEPVKQEPTRESVEQPKTKEKKVLSKKGKFFWSQLCKAYIDPSGQADKAKIKEAIVELTGKPSLFECTDEEIQVGIEKLQEAVGGENADNSL